MSVPPFPPPFDQLGTRAFSFYPPIVNVQHNEWVFRSSSWSEVLVANTKAELEIWIPRRFLGQVSRVDEPVMILGLVKELEYKSGTVWPHERRVIEMPRAVNDVYRPAEEAPPPPQPAPVIGIRLESAAESRVGRLLIGVIALGLALCVLFVGLYRGVLSGSRVHYRAVMQSSLGLGATDDYWSVVHRFGQPVEDKWQSDTGARQFRALKFKDPAMTVVLMGSERENALYIGALDADGRPIDSVQLRDGRNTEALVRAVGAMLKK